MLSTVYKRHGNEWLSKSTTSLAIYSPNQICHYQTLHEIYIPSICYTQEETFLSKPLLYYRKIFILFHFVFYSYFFVRRNTAARVSDQIPLNLKLLNLCISMCDIHGTPRPFHIICWHFDYYSTFRTNHLRIRN